jgi:hypothetical protein
MDILDDEWKYLPRLPGDPKSTAAPPPPEPAEIAPAQRAYLARLFEIDWLTEPFDVQQEYERLSNALIQETTDNPQEVWTSFEKNESTGQVRAIEHRLRNVGKIGSWDAAFFVVKMIKTEGPFEFSDFSLETSVESVDRNARFGIRAKPDHFQRDRPF